MDNNNTPENVSYTVYQEAQARADRRFKYMWITVMFLIMLLVGSNAGWLIYESQYQKVVVKKQTVSQDSADGGDNTFTGDFYGGDYYGKTDNNNDSH